MNPLDSIAEQYVKLCFSIDRHDPGYVDFYYGPVELKEQAERENLSLNDAGRLATLILSGLHRIDQSSLDDFERRRFQSLRKTLQSAVARLDILQGIRLSFDEEVDLIFHTACPRFSEEDFRGTLQQIDALLPGGGTVPERMERLRRNFLVPADSLDAVLQAAVAEARRRTKENLPLPPGEDFKLEYVSGTPWPAYNWFKGNGQSLIQINSDLPFHLEWALLIAGHEGYPGHHTFWSMREEEFYRKRGWVEFSICPLYGPLSLIAEGLANFGVRVAFPALDKRIAFEREVLCPAAGIRPNELETYDRIIDLTSQLGWAEVEAARRYLDGLIPREEALKWLTDFRLYPRETAEKQLEFIERYRAYVINYSLGEQMIQRYVEARGGTAENRRTRWEEYGKLLTTPMLPGELK